MLARSKLTITSTCTISIRKKSNNIPNLEEWIDVTPQAFRPNDFVIFTYGPRTGTGATAHSQPYDSRFHLESIHTRMP